MPPELKKHKGRTSGREVGLRIDMPRWMRTHDNITGLIDLYAHADVDGAVGIEVGCFWGESAEIAAQFLGRLCCVDAWVRSHNEGMFDERTERFTNICKFKTKSHVAAQWIADDSADLVYIDARHDYDNVKRDILSWFPKVQLQGWIAGHDYDDQPSHVGVVRAVDEILGRPQMLFADNSFLMRKTPDLVARVTELFPKG